MNSRLAENAADRRVEDIFSAIAEMHGRLPAWYFILRFGFEPLLLLLL